MKAIKYTEYGGPEVFHLVSDVEKPIPNENELLVKVHTTTVPIAVMLARTGKHPNSKLFTVLARLMFGIRKPRKPILGYEFAGEVESVGKDVSQFKQGDQVVGTTTGLKQGAYAEYVCVPETWKLGVVTKKFPDVSYEEAAAIPVAGMAVVHILKKITIQKGQKVLVNGASGSVGSYAVQLAKYYGAKVTGVCSTPKLAMVKSIGADKVIDYSKEDFSQNGEVYDLIFDAAGKLSRSQCKASLTTNGTFLTSKSPTSEKVEYLVFLQELLQAGKLQVVIDRSYPLEAMVEAHQYVDGGHKKGNVLIIVAHSSGEW